MWVEAKEAGSLKFEVLCTPEDKVRSWGYEPDNHKFTVSNGLLEFTYQGKLMYIPDELMTTHCIKVQTADNIERVLPF